MADKFYRIKDWDENFETSKTLAYKNLKSFLCPNKFDGDGYTALMDHEDGVTHYGVWIILCGVASKTKKPNRGCLLRDNGKPHTAKTIARMTRIPEKIVSEAIDRLCDPEIGWLESQGVDTKEVADSRTSKSLPRTSKSSAGTSSSSARPLTEPNRTKPNNKNRSQKATGIFSRLDLSVLRDSEKLDAWFRLAARSDSVPIRDTIPDQRYVFGCAERAIELGKNPAAMFVKLVKARLENISNAQDDKAVARIKTLRGPPRGTQRSTGSDADVGVGLTFEDKHKRRTRQREKSSRKAGS